MRALTIREFRSSVGHLDQLAQQYGEITITNRGKPVLRVLPAQIKPCRPLHQTLRQKISLLNVSSARCIREDRDER